ncbi:MAG: hypothetical protein J6W88_06140 [Bacteroidales bacterium]|nr:hypothetical protein [Bacteroidales bacterium]
MNRKQLILLALMLMPVIAMGQKPKTVEFSSEQLPDELQEYVIASIADNDRQKECKKTVKAFRASYGSLDERSRERLAAIYNYCVKAKMRPATELMDMTATITAYAAASGGTMNFEGWVKAMETFSHRNAKAKYVNEFVDWSRQLLNERVFYHSSSSEWGIGKSTSFVLDVENDHIVVRLEMPTDLYYSSAKDRNTIHGTTGTYVYDEGVWRGNGGRIDWARTGLGAEACYADLANYTAEVKFPKFSADSVSFINTHYFSNPIKGHVDDALSNSMEPEKYSYPRFRSYQRDFVIPNIMPDVDYSGSFMMNGAKFITASSKHPATMVFHDGGKKRLNVTSMKFTVTPERLYAENAQVALLLGDEDSIWAAGINVRYTPTDKKVSLINSKQRNFYSPFIDTYHSLDIYCENIVWYKEQNRIEFSSLTDAGNAGSSFESSNYYTYRKYRAIQGIDEESPIQRVYDYAESNSYNFGIEGFSNYIGLDMSQTMLMIQTLAWHGLVTYNEITKRVLVKEKLEDYLKAYSRTKGFDYDALTLESRTRGVDARMGLDDNELTIRGVEQFVVSDSQRVVVYPDSATGYLVHVGHNRAIRFSGRLECGKFIMSVTNASFNYEQFTFDMPKIDRMEFYVPDFKNKDYEQLVRTPLTGLVGTLQVDKPDNHCGLVKNREYPIFNSMENSYVYYDRKSIQDGQYIRDKFYYTLLPFTIGSMTDFVTDSLSFNGVLTSAGIFPDIKEPLRVQRDYFLGFRIDTPTGGLPAYGGKGTYSDNICLDHNGLHGKGHIDYLSSHTSSRDFLFLPDSTLGITDTFAVREEQGFPDMRGGRTDMHWIPYADSMRVATIAGGRPISMYRQEAKLTGRVALMPKGAMAAGSAEVKEGTFESERFDLLAREMNAEVTNFTLRSNTFKGIAFSAHNVRSHVDYDSHRADLTNTAGPQRTELALMNYYAFADRFTWDMDRKLLDIANSQRGTTEGLDAMDIKLRLPKLNDMPGARFVCSDPKRGGLEWNALLSSYRYDAADLSADGVYLIAVADAAIAPNGDSIHVLKGGDIRALQTAEVICNRTNPWHHIIGADIVVEAANSYTGKGYIDYHNDTEKTQRLFLDNMLVSNGTTVATGNISDSASFMLSSAFGFAGKVRVEGNKERLYFDGGVRLVQPCIPNEQLGLLAYSDYTDPEHIHITVPELPTDWKGKRLTASILLDKNNLQPHPAFLTNERAADNELLSAHGVLTYLGDHKKYIIGSEKKVANPEGVIEPYLSLSTTDCVVEGEGPINLCLKRTQARVYAYGSATSGIRSDEQDAISTIFGLSFPIDKSLVSSMATALIEDIRLTPMPPSTNAELRHAMMYHLGAEKGGAAYVIYSSSGKLSAVPGDMQCNMLFGGIRWQYSPTVGLYYDGKAELLSMDDKPIGIELRVKAQIARRNNAQTLTLYVEAARDHWYFFNFNLASQELTIYSSVGTWVDQIKAIPLEQRKIEKEGLGMFRYFAGNNSSEVPNWLSWFSRSIYNDPDDF